MQESSSRIQINLSSKPKETRISLFLKWAVTSGKIIIVITELMALAALGYRFTIDSKIVDLHDQIKRERVLVDSQKQKENEYRSLQTRIASIKKVDSETKEKISIMNAVLAIIADGRFISTNLVVNQNSITLSGTSLSISSINSFIEELKKNTSVISISLDELSSVDDGIKFKINIETKEKKII